MMSIGVQGSLLKRRIWGAALILSILFLLQLLYNGAHLLLASDPDPVLLAADAMQPAKVLVFVDETSASALIERPVFWQSRRVLVAAGKQVEPTAQKAAVADVAALENVTLLGVFGSGSSGSIIAMVDGTQQRVAINDSVKGWELTGIKGREVTFNQRGVNKALTFEYTAVWLAPEPEPDEVVPQAGTPDDADLSVLSTGGL